MNLFQLGNFTLASGVASPWKIDCDALTDEDIRTLAEMIRQMVGLFSSVEGVPRGGLRLAEALNPFCDIGYGSRHLIVDDVLTSGGSMERALQDCLSHAPKVGAVIFARGECPSWIYPLFQMSSYFLSKPRTRGTR